MGTFVEFIESESFFPILILLLVLLMFVFAYILMSGKKNKRKRTQGRKKIRIDENAQVQLVQEHGMARQLKKEEEVLEVETGSTEVNLFLEEEDFVKSVDINEFENTKDNSFKRDPIQVPAYSTGGAVNVKEKERNHVNLSDKNDIPPFIIFRDELKNQYRTPSSEVINDTTQKQSFNTELTESLNENNRVRKEFEAPYSNFEEKSTDIPVIIDDKKIDNNNAFDFKPDDNNNINEDIQLSDSKEDFPDKTEVLDFPDFDSLSQETGIEKTVIDAANKYIESIMNR